MTPLADLPPDTHPVSSGVREIGALLDTVLACSEPVPASEVASVVEALERITRRAEALTLRILAEQSVADASAREGYADTGSWLARRTRTTRRDAARATQLAEDLTAAPATGAALGAGDLSPEHARVITGALTALPDTLTDRQRASVEADLVAQAARTDPARLRRAARRALAVIEPDPAVVDAHENDLVTAEEDTAHARARLTLHDNGDGTLSGHFTVPRLAGDVLRRVLDAMTAPRRRHGHSSVGVLPDTDWAHRRGTAFAELLEHLPTDHLNLKTAATIVVQLRHDVLLGALAAAHTDTDQPLSAGTARRLACTAGLVPAVLGGRSLPLDLGREQRLFTQAQRVALATRHSHCAAAGCERPYAWCELHHRRPWSTGGRTDLADAVPLCGHHHRLVHHPGYDHRDTADGIAFLRRRGPSAHSRSPRVWKGAGSDRAAGADRAPTRSAGTIGSRVPAPRRPVVTPMRT